MTAEEIQWEDDLLITNDVARAIEEQELVAYYQPVMDTKTRRVVSVEALVRWNMPDGTVVPAGLFVPSLARTDTIVGLDWFMAEDTCTFFSGIAETQAFVPFSLNFSTRHALDPDFAHKLAATIRWHNIPGEIVSAEIDTDIVLDGEAEDLISSVRDEGIGVIADNVQSADLDFTELRKRRIALAKLSRVCWVDMDANALAKFVHDARWMGVTLCATGVETEEEFATLKAGGITQVQGYLLGAPMSGEDYLQLFA